MSEHDSSFLSRWSRRKAQVREDPALRDEAASPLPVPLPVPSPTTTPGLSGAAAVAPTAVPAAASTQPVQDRAATRQPGAVAPAPAPTLDDVAALSLQSDYTRFVARGVTPEVKNAALKKLFTDPHFNLMDGLDTYIDDYGKPDPLPADMLRKMVQSQLLGLFDHEKKADIANGTHTAEPAPTAAALAPGAQADTALPTAQVEPKAQSQPEAAAACSGAVPGASDDAAPH